MSFPPFSDFVHVSVISTKNNSEMIFCLCGSPRRFGSTEPMNGICHVAVSFLIQNTQEIKRTLFFFFFFLDETGQNVQIFEKVLLFKLRTTKERKKQTINSDYLVSVGCGRLAEGKGHETDAEVILDFSSA